MVRLSSSASIPNLKFALLCDGHRFVAVEVTGMKRGVGRPLAVLVPGDAERSFPERRARRRRVSRSLSEHCRMILRCAEGVPNKVAAAELGVDRRTVGKWPRRFVRDRLDGLSDGPRSGRPRTVGDDRVAYVLGRTLHTTPPDAIRWSTRPMARESGLSQTTVGAFGTPSGCSRTVREPSNSPAIPHSRTRSATS